MIVADTFNNRVSRWSPTLGTTTWLSTAFSFPKDVAVANNVVYVADTGNNRVVELNALTGVPIRTFGGLHAPEGIAVDWTATSGCRTRPGTGSWSCRHRGACC